MLSSFLEEGRHENKVFSSLFLRRCVCIEEKEEKQPHPISCPFPSNLESREILLICDQKASLLLLVLNERSTLRAEMR